MNSNETSSESLQPLMVRFAMMKIRLVRIVSDYYLLTLNYNLNIFKAVKSDIANMIARSSATSLPASSAESVEMLVTWPKTVRIASGELIGATMVLVSILVAGPIEVVMQWIVRWK